MSDITMCAGWYHAECKECRRRVSKPAMQQAYIDPPRKSPCKYYLEIEDVEYGTTNIHSRSKQQS